MADPKSLTAETVADSEASFEAMLTRLEQVVLRLERGDLPGMNLEDLARYLGEEASRSIQTFLQFMNFLRDSGFVAAEEGRLVLTPKAMRMIAQKALRDIYALMLLQDSMNNNFCVKAALAS